MPDRRRYSVMTYILVVEDSPVERKILSHLLQKNGLTVQVATDGLDAIDAIQRKTPNLVITDIEMPRMNGYQLCHWLKNHSRSTQIPVVVCSSNREPWQYCQAAELGVEVYITKPIHLDRVLNAVWQLLQDSPV